VEQQTYNMARIKKNNKRQTRKTHLIVGEGIADITLLKAINKVYGSNTQYKLKFDAADGGCPFDIINHACGLIKYHGYDKGTVFMDSDIAICIKGTKLLKKNNLTLILSKPICLEGFLLSVLNVKVPFTDANVCKKELEKVHLAPYNFRDVGYYIPIFDGVSLDKVSNSILKSILTKIFEHPI
jgi:hypothetical protein